jgi:hypothetical protein
MNSVSRLAASLIAVVSLIVPRRHHMAMLASGVDFDPVCSLCQQIGIVRGLGLTVLPLGKLTPMPTWTPPANFPLTNNCSDHLLGIPP